MQILIFQNHEINKEKYDCCIESSQQGTVYALSWYLDVVAPGWQLLATADYQFVMPLPVKKRYGIYYSLQPPLCQQLGVFSKENLTPETIARFLEKIPFSYYDLQFNAGNKSESSNTPFQLNYCLNLNRNYQEIQSNYNNNCRRNLKKTTKEELVARDVTDTTAYLNILTANSMNRPIRKLMPLLKNIMEAAQKYAQLKIWHVQDVHDNILSAALFLHWKNRIYYLVPVSTPEGKQKQSMSFLIDSFIRSHSQTQLILDFEGSNIPDIARFYEGFGAIPESYPRFTKKGLVSFIYTFAKKIK